MPADKLSFFAADLTDPAQLEAAKQAAASFLISKVQGNDLLLLKASNAIGLHTMLKNF